MQPTDTAQPPTALPGPRDPLTVMACVSLGSVLMSGGAVLAPFRPQLDLLLSVLLLVAAGTRLGAARVSLLPFLFLLWSSSSMMWTFDRYATQRELLLVWPTALSLMFAASLGGTRWAGDVLWTTLRWVMVLTVLYTVVRPGAAFAPGIDGAPGWIGPFDHKNGLGFVFAVAAIVAWDRRRIDTGQWWFGALAMIGVVLSQSSTALVTATGGVVAWHLFTKYTRQDDVARRAATLLASAVSAFLVPWLVVRNLRFVTSLVGRDSTLTGRVDIWRGVLDLVGDRPVVGQGLAAPWFALNEFNQPLFHVIKFRAYHAHNAYLDVMLQLGAVGLVLVVALLGALLARLLLLGILGDPRAALFASITTVMIANGMSESGAVLGSGTALLLFVWGAAHAPVGAVSDGPTPTPTTTTATATASGVRSAGLRRRVPR